MKIIIHRIRINSFPVQAMLCITFLFCFVSVSAQTAYKGGHGDGYASSGLELQSVGFDNNYAKLMTVYPTLLAPGQSFRLNSQEPMEELVLIDINGRKQVLNGTTSFSLPNTLPGGVYTIWMVSAQHQFYYSKLIVVDE
ncbi:MAG: hypothetical protein KDD32_04135 [Bacteroidetes bacterium]|nr:hypothetical protein [Bacteroidota bacterium]